jgi:hypothetical protein
MGASKGRIERRREMRRSAGFPAFVLTAATIAFAWHVQAEEASPSTQAQPSPPAVSAPAQASDISEQKLDAAAAAVKSVTAVKEDYESKLAAVAEEAHTAMKKAIAEHGLSVEEYTAIIEVAQGDPALRQKILDRLK